MEVLTRRENWEQQTQVLFKAATHEGELWSIHFLVTLSSQLPYE